MAEQQPDIQLIANLVVLRPDGRVLFVRYQPDDERWWLPGEDLEPYEHPDERARAVLASLARLDVDVDGDERGRIVQRPSRLARDLHVPRRGRRRTGRRVPDGVVPGRRAAEDGYTAAGSGTGWAGRSACRV